MRIGILGSGLMDGKLGTIFARAGHDVVFTYSPSQRELKRLAREAQGQARAGTPGEASLHADALLLAVHWSRVDAVLKQAGDSVDAGPLRVARYLEPSRSQSHNSRTRATKGLKSRTASSVSGGLRNPALCR
jgi:3-hydroxyisobutyrate dehydrogenase-like beta-hydroxyacid dehydrogenase